MQTKWSNNSLCLPLCFWRESLRIFLMNWGSQKNLALGHIWLAVVCRLSWVFGFLSGRTVWPSLHRSCWTPFNFLIQTSVKLFLQWLKIWVWIILPLKKNPLRVNQTNFHGLSKLLNANTSPQSTNFDSLFFTQLAFTCSLCFPTSFPKVITTES